MDKGLLGDKISLGKISAARHSSSKTSKRCKLFLFFKKKKKEEILMIGLVKLGSLDQNVACYIVLITCYVGITVHTATSQF